MLIMEFSELKEGDGLMAGMTDEIAAFIESAGAHVCRSAELTVKGFAGVMGAAADRVKRSFAPAVKDISKIPENVVNNSSAPHEENEDFVPRRKGKRILRTAFNIIFPAVSVGAFAVTVNSAMTTDYGVAVEYDGEEIGVVSGEEVLGEAQCVVADRVKYYDTDGDYYVTAALTIKPLSGGEDVMDETALAEKMEDRISMKYDEKPPEVTAPDEEENVIDTEGKVKAFAVRVDGEFLGAVEDYAPIEAALDNIKAPYNTGEYLEVDFDKDVEYDLEEYVYPEDVVPVENILKILTGNVSSPEYYEVQPGDYLLKIADEKGMSLEELCSCYATYNGKEVEDIGNNVLRVGTLIRIDSEVPYLQVECDKEITIRNWLDYNTITIEDPNLAAGETVIETEGCRGEKRSRAIVTYREDVAVKKKVLESVIYKEPVSEIIRMGTGTPGINHNVPEFITDGGTGDYFWPVDGGYISSHQGDGRGHKGIDIAAPFGTPIYAAASGVVIDASSGGEWNGGYGNCIMIQNDDGNITVYAHQSEIAAAPGDVIKQGQLIGYVGSTGDSRGNHLHFEVRSNGKYYDPELFVSLDRTTDTHAEPLALTEEELKQYYSTEVTVSETETVVTEAPLPEETTVPETEPVEETISSDVTVSETAESVSETEEVTTAVNEEDTPAETSVTEVTDETDVPEETTVTSVEEASEEGLVSETDVNSDTETESNDTSESEISAETDETEVSAK